jgi:hypothetical protein
MMVVATKRSLEESAPIGTMDREQGLGYIPQECGENGGGSGYFANVRDMAARIANERCCGNPASEPEDAGENLNC